MGEKIGEGEEKCVDKFDEPLIEVQRNDKRSTAQQVKEEGTCIVLVGTTGTGKTTCLNIYTGASLPTGDSAQSVTEETVAVEDKLHGPGAPIWVDMPGWSDSEGNSDIHAFKELLKHLQKNKLFNLKAVLWCVSPTPRMDAMLQQQAQYINTFTAEDASTREKEAGAIWDNVVIVCKGKLAADLATDVQGAMMAAKPHNVHAQPLALRYEFATEEVVAGTTEALRKDVLCQLTHDEVRQELEAVLARLPAPMRVVFSQQMCLACGQEGDPRLMEDRCHRDKVRGHTGDLEQRFTKKQAGVSLGLGGVASAVLIGLAAATATPLVLLAMVPVMAPGLAAAGHRFLNTKAEAPPTCGCVPLKDMRWSCCGRPELETGGCTDRCDQCHEVWGQGKPCILIKHPDANMAKGMTDIEVHVKEHELAPLPDTE